MTPNLLTEIGTKKIMKCEATSEPLPTPTWSLVLGQSVSFCLDFPSCSVLTPSKKWWVGENICFFLFFETFYINSKSGTSLIWQLEYNRIKIFFRATLPDSNVTTAYNIFYQDLCTTPTYTFFTASLFNTKTLERVWVCFRFFQV